MMNLCIIMSVLLHEICLYCVRYTHQLVIQLTVRNMSIVQYMQFRSSYVGESYNEHEFMYHDFYTIA